MFQPVSWMPRIELVTIENVYESFVFQSSGTFAFV